jgi:hypothetical protein
MFLIFLVCILLGIGKARQGKANLFDVLNVCYKKIVPVEPLPLATLEARGVVRSFSVS